MTSTVGNSGYGKYRVINCVCGGKYTFRSIRRHFNTPQCKSYVNKYFNVPATAVPETALGECIECS